MTESYFKLLGLFYKRVCAYYFEEQFILCVIKLCKVFAQNGI